MNLKKFVLGGLILCVLMNTNIFSQNIPEARVIKAYPNGSYLVEITGKQYLTVTEKMEQSMLKTKRDLLDAQKQIVLKDSLLANTDKTIAWYDTTMKNMKLYIVELESILKGYKGLLKDYKRLKEPWLNVRWGIGATSRDYKPAVLMGLGIKRLQISGFVQEQNSGVLVGTQFRLF